MSSEPNIVVDVAFYVGVALIGYGIDGLLGAGIALCATTLIVAMILAQ